MVDAPDLLIAGAGPVGCVIAERAATELGLTSLIVERRKHIGGNCHDRSHSNGVLIHAYGPHYFRASDPAIVDYLSKFTEWIPGNYIVKSSTGGKLYPFPINLTTLEIFFDRALTSESAEALLREQREPIAEPKNSEEVVLASVGRALYEAFYEGYTTKQWGRHPRELDPSVCARIPVRLDRDERYVNEGIQVTPKAGFTAMFERMTRHPRIRFQLATDYREIRTEVRPRVATVYTGPLDQYFDERLGPLPWRSLEFELEVRDEALVQPCVQINYPNQHAYTRSVEIKHVTGQQHPQTVLTYEHPRAVGEPFYPVPAPDSRAQFARYRELAERESREQPVYFVGRLAEYRYMNTDEAVQSALDTYAQIRARVTGD